MINRIGKPFSFLYLCKMQITGRKLLAGLAMSLIALSLYSCGGEVEEVKVDKINHFTIEDYKKTERYITMRDGIKLWTTIYSPIDDSQDYPVILKRTPYSCAPYGADTIPASITHNPHLLASGYHFVIQDVRGRWMSEGPYENVKPPYSFWDKDKTDEVTDSWDTFQWLEDSLENYNGKAGMYGNSYLGWTSLVGARCNHPSLQAVIAMAPVTDFYFEDFNRYGLFAMNYIPVLNFFGTQHGGPTTDAWWPTRDSIFWVDKQEGIGQPYYEFFLERMTLSNFDDILDSTNFFWKNIREHSTYDEFHQRRGWIQYLDDIDCQVMISGGFNDEQNLYGNLNSYKKMAQHSDNVRLVLGPWSHGHNKWRDSLYYLGNIFLGYNLGKDYQDDIELPYFEYYLKGRETPPDFKVRLYDGGTLAWKEFDEFPVKDVEEITYYLQSDQVLSTTNNDGEDVTTAYISDPFKPVPFLDDNEFYNMAPKKYFTDDQRFLKGRPDVLSWVSEPLDEDVTVLGEIKALINFATDHEDADIYVKVIDIYPDDRPSEDTDKEGINYQGYERLVRLGYIRGRYRESFESGKPFAPNEKTEVAVPLLEVYHTFKKGHRIMVQVQSSMFPLFDLNPQQYIEDIYTAKKSDFQKATHKVFSDSKIILPVYKEKSAL